MKHCILEKLRQAACARHNVDKVFPAIHNHWGASYGMKGEGLMKHHVLEFHLYEGEKTAHEIAINVLTEKTLEQECEEGLI